MEHIVQFEILTDTYDCCPVKFEVNGKKADYTDFVEKYDHDEEHAPEYGCGDMRCDPKQPTPDVLAKYGITIKEYEKITEALCDKLNIGYCEWCV